jgi:hypothetical protein
MGDLLVFSGDHNNVWRDDGLFDADGHSQSIEASFQFTFRQLAPRFGAGGLTLLLWLEETKSPADASVGWSCSGS